MLAPNIVFGYHGCDESVARRVLEGGELAPSRNDWDWLGHGIYFWEGSAARALRWAGESTSPAVRKPAVLGAIIDLGQCLNLIDPTYGQAVRQAHRAYISQCAAVGLPPLRNKGPESKARFLDCAVMNFLHQLREAQGEVPFETVRGFFIEGEPLYPTAGLRSLDHVQVCVRAPHAILGFFRPNPRRIG